MNFPRAIITLMVVLALGFASQPLLAATSGNFTYTDLGSSIRIDLYPTSATGAVTIPSTITNKPVTIIGESAFHGCRNLTSVSIPATVITIDNFAFAYCSGLPSVSIPASVTTINYGAFTSCSSLTSATFQGNAPTLGRYVFDDTASGFKVLYDFSKTGFSYPTWNGYSTNPTGTGTTPPLTYTAGSTGVTITDCATNYSGVVTIPASFNGVPVTIIGPEAFRACSSLTGVNIPASVTRIEYLAFGQCPNLASVNLPASLTSIGVDVFHDCHSLASVSLPASLTNIEAGAFYGCGLTSVSLPANVTNIGSYAFLYCTNLTSATFLGNAPTTGVQIFDGAASGFTVNYDLNKTGFTAPAWNGYPSVGTGISPPLTYKTNGTGVIVFACNTGYSGALTIPSSIYGQSVISIGSQAFLNCAGVTSVNIPASVTSIGNGAFSGCAGLTYAAFFGSAPTMGTQVFAGASSGFTVRFDFTKTGFGYPMWNGYPTNGFILDYPLTYVSDGTSMSITDCDTDYSGVVTIQGNIYGQPVTSIGNEAFRDCRNLTNVNIPNSVTSIGVNAFYGSGLTNMSIPNSVTQIGENAFEYCRLTSVSIGSGVTSIGRLVFHGSGLTSVSIPSSVTSIGNEAFRGCASLTSVNIPNSVTSIGQSAFLGSGLTSVSIPSSVTSIGYETFRDCTSLTSVNIPNSVTSIGDYAFYGCGLTSVSIPNSVTYIGESAFQNCNLMSVNIGSGITSIGRLVFSGCSLTSVSIPNNVTSIGEGAFYLCQGLISVSIPDSVTSIGDVAFFMCYALTNVSIGSGVTSIGSFAFSACDALTSVNIPNSVTSIGNEAFSSCFNLTSIIIGSGVTDIGETAFMNCYLSSATFLGNAPTMGSTVFYNTAPDFTVYFDLSKTGFTEPTWNGYPSSGQSPTQMWRLQHFGTNANTGNAANSADPDHDGVVNTMERAFNLNPKQAGQTILTAGTGTTGVPLIRASGAPGARVLSIQYLRRKASTNPGLIYTPQFSSDLGTTWQNAAGAETVESINSDWERVTIPDTASSMAKRFGRVKVSTTP